MPNKTVCVWRVFRGSRAVHLGLGVPLWVTGTWGLSLHEWTDPWWLHSLVGFQGFAQLASSGPCSEVLWCTACSPSWHTALLKASASQKKRTSKLGSKLLRPWTQVTLYSSCLPQAFCHSNEKLTTVTEIRKPWVHTCGIYQEQATGIALDAGGPAAHCGWWHAYV